MEAHTCASPAACHVEASATHKRKHGKKRSSQWQHSLKLSFKLTLCHTQDALAANITQEQGKTLADAKGDVFRGLGMHVDGLLPMTQLQVLT